MRKLALSLLRLICLAALLGAYPRGSEAAPPTIFTVDSTLDTPDINLGNGFCVDPNGKCTLRAAVMESIFDSNPDTIVLPPGTYLLTRAGAQEDSGSLGDLDLQGDIILQGAGAGVTVVDATGLGDRVFDVFTGTQATLSGLTFTGGFVASGPIRDGSGLANHGTLTLTQVMVAHNNPAGVLNDKGGGIINWGNGVLTLNSTTVISNQADTGAGIYNFGQMTLSASNVISNHASQGGGIFNVGVAALSGSQVLSNTSNFFGGGVTLNGGSLAVNNSVVRANSSRQGGGLSMHAGLLTVTGSTLSSNTVISDGAGLATFGGLVTITASTLISNVATTGDGGAVHMQNGDVALFSSALLSNIAGLDGGAASLLGGHMLAVNTTMSLNQAKNNGGAVFSNGGIFNTYNDTIAFNFANSDDISGGSGGGLYRITGAVNLRNTVLAGNVRSAAGLGIDADCAGVFVGGGLWRYSLVGSDLGCSFSNDNTLVNVNPLLQPLALNGGPTLNFALAPNSPALDAADPAGCPSPAGGFLLTDQRGQPRPADGDLDGATFCDIGAYEARPQIFLPLLMR